MILLKKKTNIIGNNPYVNNISSIIFDKVNFRYPNSSLIALNNINLQWIIEAYNKSKNKSSFFRNGFNKLAGNSKLQKQIINGISEKEIKESWKNNIEEFKIMRSKYLLYN